MARAMTDGLPTCHASPERSYGRCQLASYHNGEGRCTLDTALFRYTPDRLWEFPYIGPYIARQSPVRRSPDIGYHPIRGAVFKKAPSSQVRQSGELRTRQRY